MDYRNSTSQELQDEIDAMEQELSKRQEVENIPSYIARQVSRWKELCPNNPDGWAAEIEVDDEDDDAS